MWVDSFLRTVIENCYRFLKPKKYLVINISDSNHYSLESDTKHIAEAFFKFQSEYHLRMNAMPAFRSNGKLLYRFEPIFVFQKK